MEVELERYRFRVTVEYNAGEATFFDEEIEAYSLEEAVLRFTAQNASAMADELMAEVRDG